MTAADRIRVGVLTEPYLYEWQVRALDRLQTRPDIDVDLSLVVCNETEAECEAESWNTRGPVSREDIEQFLEVLRTEKAWTFVLAGRSIGRLLGEQHTLWHRHSVENVTALADSDHIRCEPHTDGNWNELPKAVVETVRDRCDVVVRFGFGLVKGEILTAPKYGVLSFHPADIRRYRGMGPPAIFHDGQTRAGSTLQRLNESIDGGEIVAYREVSIADCHTLWDVFDRLASVQIDLLSEGISRLGDPTVTPQTIPDAELGAFYPRALRRSIPFAGRVFVKNAIGFLRNRLEEQAVEDRTPNRLLERGLKVEGQQLERERGLEAEAKQEQHPPTHPEQQADADD